MLADVLFCLETPNVWVIGSNCRALFLLFRVTGSRSINTIAPVSVAHSARA
jgi:hypothetical protein